MSAPKRFTNEELIEAYNATGSIWKAAKRLGVCGQSVHERLRALGHPMANRCWTREETDELAYLLAEMPLSKVAERLGRTYAAVATRASRLGVGVGAKHRSAKLPRGAGYTKARMEQLRRTLDRTPDLKPTILAKREGLGVEAMCQALERYFPEWWEDYRRAHSDLPEKDCAYCSRTFVPSTGKQRYCSRQCGNEARVDRSYFAGNRRNTVGLAEGVCQLCGRKGVKGLSSHHVFGKENDPTGLVLVALCPGCHQIVGTLAGRKFLDEEGGWEALISLVHVRRHGTDPEYEHGVYVYVEVEPGWEDEEEEAAS